MLFSSKEFLFIFLPVMITGYYLIYLLFRKNPLSIRIRNTWLLTGSLVFYAWGEPVYVFLMIAVIVFNYVMGRMIGRRRQRWSLALTVSVNLLILGFYKYAGFLCGIVTDIAGRDVLPVTWSESVEKIALPIGISFYTFQALSYVIDVYRDKIKAEKDPLALGLYISFFPQLIAGPIVRFETISEAIRERKETFDLFAKGAERFIRGIIKKVLIADRMAVVADAVFALVIGDKLEATVLMAWLGAISYSLQIFFDFSGYCDMAAGLGLMFGFKLPDNFDHPYIAKSVTEFWRRWHITLSGWFRDYVYIPLGGSRVGKGRLVLNLFVVWLLTGIWHGANYTFIAWGMIYFVVLTVEKLLMGRRAGSSAFGGVTGEPEARRSDVKPVASGQMSKSATGVGAVLGHIYTLIVVCIAWVFFRSDSINNAFLYVKGMFGLSGTAMASKAVWAYIIQNIPFYVAAILLCMPVREKLEELVGMRTDGGNSTDENIQSRVVGTVYRIIYLAVLAAGMLLAITYIFNNSYSPFIYFNF